MAPMKRKVNDGKEDGDRPEPPDRRSQQRVGDGQRSRRGSAFAPSRVEMLEHRYQLPVRPERLEKS